MSYQLSEAPPPPELPPSPEKSDEDDDEEKEDESEELKPSELWDEARPERWREPAAIDPDHNNICPQEGGQEDTEVCCAVRWRRRAARVGESLLERAAAC